MQTPSSASIPGSPAARFAGKRVLITGAASGIGRQVAENFIAEGAQVIGLDLSPADEPATRQFRLMTLDITDPSAVEENTRTLLAEGFIPDVIINAAGTLRLGNSDTLSVDDWHACINVNATGPFLLLRQWVPHLRERGQGAIVNIASNAAHVPRIGMAAYCASKAALAAFSHCVALELAPYGVRCNVVSPGSTRTPMLTRMQDGMADDTPFIAGTPASFKLGIPLGKVARPDDIARVVLFLASDDANHVTMQDIVADGGATLAA